MHLMILMELDSAAFADGQSEEVGRILASVAERIPEPLRVTDQALSLHDANGNYCGSAAIVPDSKAKRIAAADDLFEAAVSMRKITKTTPRARCDAICEALDAAIRSAI